jgi:beta-lactamase regulating signal transducer with metallopeptidase domain
MHAILNSALWPFLIRLIVDASWKGLLLLMVATVAAFAANKSSAAVRHRIWCLSFSALIFLPILSVSVPRWHVPLLPSGESTQLVNDRDSANSRISQSLREIAESDRPGQRAFERPSRVEPAGSDSFSATNPVTSLNEPHEIRWPTDALIRLSLTVVWILVALALIGRLAVETVAVRRLMGRCRPLCDAGWNSLLCDSQARLRLRRSVRLLECDEAIVPFTCGLVRPLILLPATSREWSVERQRCVLLHELAHIKRCDVFFQMVARAACSLYWCNPLAWYALARLRIERELACDDCVVAAGESAVDYADQLVEIARSCRSSRYAVGIAMARTCNLEARVVALLDRARSRRLLSRPISALLALGALLLVIAAAAFQPIARAAEKGQTANAKIPLKRGLTVTGKVTDESGRPIAGALVKTKFSNDLRQAVSGPDGVYHLVGCEPALSRIVVSAKGRATDMKELSINAEMKPVDFQMKPGGKIRVRVVDQNGKPVPRARIFFQWWRGKFQYFEFKHVNDYADQNGLWQWNEAPLDEFKADICPREGMNLASRPLVARSQEYVFRLPPPLVITGKVIDRETKQPIKKFRVVPGIRSSPSWMNWARGESFTAIDGTYRMSERQDYFAYIVRIEADGYEPADSRDIKSNEGTVSVDFELTKGKDIDATVLTPDGRPAAGAHIAMGVGGAQIIVSNGDVEHDMTYADRQQSDQSGHFHFPPQEGPLYLIITHPSGYARFRATPSSNRRIINLDPWTRVEGIYRVGGKPQANIPITILRGDTMPFERNRMGRPDSMPHVVTFDDVTTGPNGHFVFERVMAGHGTVGRRLMLTSNDGATEVSSQCRVETKFPPGKTVHLDFPALGRAVVGTLHRPIGDKEKIRWSFAEVEIEPEKAEAPAARPHFSASVAPDGTFRVDDLPAGDFALNVRFQLGQGGFLFNHHFQVPKPNASTSASPLDLGVLTLREK